jgi:hypothetical protein
MAEATCMLFEGDPCLMSAAGLEVDETGGWIPDPHPCTEPPAATVTFACIHEHVDKPRACYGCAAEVQRVAGLLSCPRCDYGPDPHACTCLVVIDWDSGEKTIVQEPAHA